MRQRWSMFARVVVADFMTNNCPYIAAGIAYWTLFSLFPLSLASVSILSFINSTPVEQERMVERIIDQVPVSADYLLDIVRGVVETRGALSTIAILGLLLSSTAAFSAIRKGINHAFHVTRPHPFFIGRGIDMLMLLSVVLLATIAATNLLGLLTLGATSIWLVEAPVVNLAIEVGVLLLTIGILAILYRFVPYTPVTWRDVWLGAAVGGVLVHVTRLTFSGFLINVGEFNLVYGSLGAVMALLLWIYLTALSLVMGAEVGYVYSRAFGSRKTVESLSALQSRFGLGRSFLSRKGFAGLVGDWFILPRRPR